MSQKYGAWHAWLGQCVLSLGHEPSRPGRPHEDVHGSPFRATSKPGWNGTIRRKGRR